MVPVTHFICTVAMAVPRIASPGLIPDPIAIQLEFTFIEKYPNVGLLVCLGEAMCTVEDDVEWFTKTIIPGVKDGLQALGRTDEPPLLLRAHDTDCKLVMDAALPLYKNLYTMHKYNGESLTTYEPRGPWSKIHTDLSSLGSIHIMADTIMSGL